MDRIERLRSAGVYVVMRLSRSAAVPGRRRPANLAAALAIGLMVTSAAVAAGCGAQQISLTSKDNKATIKASKGDTIILKLDENPSTGYHWVMQFSGGLKVASSEYKQRAGTQNLVGAGGTRTWTIDVVESGKQKITGAYEPPGTQTVSPQRFSVTVDAG
jgi:inhibitor of cysteine peptidase